MKGRRFPSGDVQKQYWKNWLTRDDLRSLANGRRCSGGGFRGLFVFAYDVLGDRAPLPAEELFEFRGNLYGFIAVPLGDYAGHAADLAEMGHLGDADRRVPQIRPAACGTVGNCARLELHFHAKSAAVIEDAAAGVDRRGERGEVVGADLLGRRATPSIHTASHEARNAKWQVT